MSAAERDFAGLLALLDEMGDRGREARETAQALPGRVAEADQKWGGRWTLLLRRLRAGEAPTPDDAEALEALDRFLTFAGYVAHLYSAEQARRRHAEAGWRDGASKAEVLARLGFAKEAHRPRTGDIELRYLELRAEGFEGRAAYVELARAGYANSPEAAHRTLDRRRREHARELEAEEAKHAAHLEQEPDLTPGAYLRMLRLLVRGLSDLPAPA